MNLLGAINYENLRVTRKNIDTCELDSNGYSTDISTHYEIHIENNQQIESTTEQSLMPYVSVTTNRKISDLDASKIEIQSVPNNTSDVVYTEEPMNLVFKPTKLCQQSHANLVDDSSPIKNQMIYDYNVPNNLNGVFKHKEVDNFNDGDSAYSMSFIELCSTEYETNMIQRRLDTINHGVQYINKGTPQFSSTFKDSNDFLSGIDIISNVFVV